MSYDANIYYKREEYVVVPKSAEDITHAKSYLEPHLLRLKQHDFPFMLHKFKRQQTVEWVHPKNTQRAALYQVPENKQSNNILGLYIA